MSVKPVEQSMQSESFKPLMEQELDQECLMINLLRFREWAKYSADDSEFTEPLVSGMEAFKRYIREARASAKSAPGGIIWLGKPKLTLIGPDDEHWHLAFVRRYHTLQSYIDMISSPAHVSALRHRRAAISDSRLIYSVPSEFAW